ncbi:MAG TPA: amidase [Caulobacteraceae bacterium]
MTVGDSARVDRRQLMGLGALAAAGLASRAEGRAAGVVEMGAGDLAAAIRTRQVSCVEVTEAFLAQIDRLNGRYNAIVSLRDRSDVLKDAAKRDASLARGESVGPLHGLPHAVKDLAPLKGVRFTQGGSPLYRDRIAAADNLPTARIRAAGVVFLGKTNAPEFGLGSHTVNPVFGATHNAYDPARSAGGSSGGAAVALALRMLPLADGSDYGGSLRNPAGWNNVYGFRTSYGRVPDVGPQAWLPSMATPGPMARSVADLALLLSVQAGYDRRTPLAMEGDGRALRDPPPEGMRGKRVGWLNYGAAVPYEPEVISVCKAALKRFEALGCEIGEAIPDVDPERAWQAFVRLRAWQQFPQLAPFVHDPAARAMLNPQAMFEADLAQTLTAFDITEASVVRTEWSRSIDKLFDRFDILISPTAQLFPFDIGWKWPEAVAGQPMRTYHEWMKGVCLITMAGTPSLAAPVGFSSAGLPIGIEIIGPVHHEMACLQAAAAYEAVEPLARTHRPAALQA